MSETDAAPAPRRRRDAVATRQALLDAARRLMSEHGVAGTSTRDIAALAGVNQTLVYRYFGSKDELVREAASGEAASVDVGSVPLDQLSHALVEDMFDRSEAAAARDGAAFWTFVSGADDELVRDVTRERIETLFGQQLAARLDGADPAVRAELFSALLVGLVFLRTKLRTPALAAADRETIARYVDRVATALLEDPGGAA